MARTDGVLSLLDYSLRIFAPMAFLPLPACFAGPHHCLLHLTLKIIQFDVLLDFCDDDAFRSTEFW